jgi:hypothetical protein
MGFVCLAQIGMALGDRTVAAQNAGKALDSLQKLQESWDAESRQHYGSRPDTRFAVSEINSLIAQR